MWELDLLGITTLQSVGHVKRWQTPRRQKIVSADNQSKWSVTLWSQITLAER